MQQTIATNKTRLSIIICRGAMMHMISGVNIRNMQRWCTRSQMRQVKSSSYSLRWSKRRHDHRTFSHIGDRVRSLLASYCRTRWRWGANGLCRKRILLCVHDREIILRGLLFANRYEGGWIADGCGGGAFVRQQQRICVANWMIQFMVWKGSSVYWLSYNLCARISVRVFCVLGSSTDCKKKNYR